MRWISLLLVLLLGCRSAPAYRLEATADAREVQGQPAERQARVAFSVEWR